MQVQEALSKFLRQLQADGRSPHTVAQYQRHVELLAKWYGPGPIEAMDHETLAIFLGTPSARCRRDGAEKKPTTMNALRTSLRVFFRYLHESGDLPTNPARLLRRAHAGVRPPRGLTGEELDRLLEVLARARDWERVLFTMMAGTGVRIGSALALDVEDVDLVRGDLHLRRMKNGHEARVPLARNLRPMLKTYLDGMLPGPLFRGASGRRVSQRHAARVFRRHLRAAGVRRVGGSHALRHTFATRLLAMHGDLALVRRALNHRSITSTIIYAEVQDSRLRAALDA